MAYQLYKQRHFHKLSSKEPQDLAIELQLKGDLIRAMNAKTITNYELDELVYQACQAGERLNNVILNLPSDLKRDLASRLHTSAGLSIYKTQSTYRSGKASRKPPQSKDLDSMIYNERAFQGNPVYLYERDKGSLTTEAVCQLFLDQIAKEKAARKKEVVQRYLSIQKERSPQSSTRLGDQGSVGSLLPQPKLTEHGKASYYAAGRTTQMTPMRMPPSKTGVETPSDYQELIYRQRNLSQAATYENRDMLMKAIEASPSPRL